jgi:hypothetical protein
LLPPQIQAVQCTKVPLRSNNTDSDATSVDLIKRMHRSPGAGRETGAAWILV